MYRVWLICVGSCKEKYWREAVAEYQKRLKGLCEFRIIELPEVTVSEKNAGPAVIEKALEKDKRC